MIVDLSGTILAFSKAYTKKTITTFSYEGITYNDTVTTSTMHGIMTPLQDTDVQRLTDLGYSIVGKQLFFVPGTESLLTEDDVVVDDSGIEWVILPNDKNGSGIDNWLEHGNFVQYTVSRKVL